MFVCFCLFLFDQHQLFRILNISRFPPLETIFMIIFSCILLRFPFPPSSIYYHFYSLKVSRYVICTCRCIESVRNYERVLVWHRVQSLWRLQVRPYPSSPFTSSLPPPVAQLTAQQFITIHDTDVKAIIPHLGLRVRDYSLPLYWNLYLYYRTRL